MPSFSVIMATYNRGRHILPSIQSVLRQNCQDFELIVVGDCCTDDTAEVVSSVASPKVRWLNLAERGGSQSFPNNAGIEMSRGNYIAYIGHDDIWMPNHLEALAGVFAGAPSPDFAVSGAIYHGPRASNFRQVTGVFAESKAAFEHFFPPSSFGHRRDVADRIGMWRNPREIVPPVDAEFLLRAANASMTFASTQRVTVHKFAAGHRYLSYVNHSSDEQERMVRRMLAAEYEGYLASEVARAKAANTFMASTYPDFALYEKGQLAIQNAMHKGVLRAELRPLTRTEVIVQDNSPKSLDWSPFEAGDDWIRWVSYNPRPKLLVPFRYQGKARIRLSIWHQKPEGLARLKLAVNEHPVVARISSLSQRGEIWRARASFETDLKQDAHTVLELHLNKLQRFGRQARGIGIAKIEVIPLRWQELPARIGQVLAAIGPGRRPS
ncbi:glycosyltransferase family 2 protein [Aminobacter sp. LjRoot7]|uniref:glycosyltransferase family 2 protein n=1 Tax=Aminobacter sp. LjRoot7 TaxID=3342335 RepID=UPI003F505A54